MTFSALPGRLLRPPVSRLQLRLLSHKVRRLCQPGLKFHFVVAAEPRAMRPTIVPDFRRRNSARWSYWRLRRAAAWPHLRFPWCYRSSDWAWLEQLPSAGQLGPAAVECLLLLRMAPPAKVPGTLRFVSVAN